jgi:AraC family ethanolamine operon transcriptional activator
MEGENFTPVVYKQNKLYDLEYINILSQGWDNRWQRVQSGNISAKLWLYTMPLIQLSWIKYNNGIMIEGSHQKGSVVLNFILSDSTINFQNRKLQKYELIILKHGEEFNYFSSGANQIFTIAVEEEYFNKEFYKFFDTDLSKIRKNYKITLHVENLHCLIYKMNFWFDYFSKNTNSLEFHKYMEVQHSLLSELFSIILFDNKKSITGYNYIKKAREILEENLDNIYTIKDLLDELDINARTLQYHFKKQLGISPKHYLQNLRLNAIHKELLLADANNTLVSDIALKYGFFHPSHFGAEYKKFFQETPTQTLYRDKPIY